MLKKISDYLFGTLGVLGALLFLGIGLLQLGLGWIGIEYHLGWWAAAGAGFLAVVMRIMLPITIGTYFGVVDVIGWPWWAGLLIAAPGIVFAVPVFVPLIVNEVIDWIQSKRG